MGSWSAHSISAAVLQQVWRQIGGVTAFFGFFLNLYDVGPIWRDVWAPQDGITCSPKASIFFEIQPNLTSLRTHAVISANRRSRCCCDTHLTRTHTHTHTTRTTLAPCPPGGPRMVSGHFCSSFSSSSSSFSGGNLAQPWLSFGPTKPCLSQLFAPYIRN